MNHSTDKDEVKAVTSLVKTVLSKIYLLLIMLFMVFCSIVTYKLTFAHIIHEYLERKEIEAPEKERKKHEKEAKKNLTFEQLLSTEERVQHNLGYRVIDERRIKGHFHHIDYDAPSDKRSYCIGCHGDMPHDKVKALRAFLNMHAAYVACQVCHMKLEGANKTGIYRWYDRETGEIVESPAGESSRPGMYKAKIIPFELVDGKPVRVDNDERTQFALEFRNAEKQGKVSEAQKSKAKKLIHNILAEHPHMCEDCHQKEAPLLPFTKLGFSQKRIDQFVSTEVVGMIRNYTKFYMPRMLNPGMGPTDAVTPPLPQEPVAQQEAKPLTTESAIPEAPKKS